MIRQVWTRFRWKIVALYALILVSELTHLVLPSLFGAAIDAVVAIGEATLEGADFWTAAWGLAFPIALWASTDFFESAINTVRYFSTGRIMHEVIAWLSLETATSQIAAGQSDSAIQTRVQLSAKASDFFQHVIPHISGACVNFFGALGILWTLNPTVALACTAFLVPVVIRGRWYAKHLVPMNSRYYDEYEKNMDVVTSHDRTRMDTHFGLLRKYGNDISDFHAKAFALLAASQVLLSCVVLGLIGFSGAAVTIGAVYSILSYVTQFTNSVDSLPGLVAEIQDIRAVMRRLAVATDVAPAVDPQEEKS